MPTTRAADPLKAQDRLTFYASLNSPPQRADALQNLSARFQSFADTVQTRLDTGNGTGPTLTGSLEAQVDRALSQVLRQAPAAGPSTAGSAGSYGAGPAGSYQASWQRGTQPAGQALSVATLLNGMGGPPAIAPRQAALLQEATLTKGDALTVLDSLQPLSAFPDPSDVAAVTAIVRAEITMLVEEFSRTTLRPRAQRVRVLLGGLLGFNPLSPQTPQNSGDVGTLITLLNLGAPIVPTLLVEQQLASQDVLTSDASQFLTQWLGFAASEGIPALWSGNLRERGPGNLGSLQPQAGEPPTRAFGPADAQALFRLAVISPGQPPAPQPLQPRTYAERLIQADLLLPVVGQDASRVAAALDAIGLSQGEQETTFVNLLSLVDLDLLPIPENPAAPPAPPGPQSTIPVSATITDLLDWTASLADATTLDLVRQAGQLGLDLIADQADELFWLVVAMLDPATPRQVPELGDAQVQQELLTLARDLTLLASLAV
jgi:hypothetical protein